MLCLNGLMVKHTLMVFFSDWSVPPVGILGGL